MKLEEHNRLLLFDPKMCRLKHDAATETDKQKYSALILHLR